MSELEEDSAEEDISEALAGWGLTAAQIAETLEATDFALGLIELRPPAGEPSPGIAIVVDDRRDRELHALFDWREQASEELYAAEWEVDGSALVRVVLGPDQQALVRWAIAIRAPAQLERRFLFAVHAVAPMLAKLQVAGTRIWLAPASLVEKEAARQGPEIGTYDIVTRCLPVGLIPQAVPSIDEALAHVGSPRE